MHHLYLEKYEPELDEGEKPHVMEWLYWKIFNEEFNYGFGYPRSDTCEKCDLLKVGTDSAQTDHERDKLQAELAAHHEKAAQVTSHYAWILKTVKKTLIPLYSHLTFSRTYLSQHLLIVPCFT